MKKKKIKKKKKQEKEKKPTKKEIRENPDLICITKFGDLMKRERICKKISQVQLSEMVDLTQGWLSKLENTNKLPDLFEAFRIMDALKISITEVIERFASQMKAKKSGT